VIFAEVVMPIYAYRCEDCGFAKDVLQKVSDAPLSACPSCGKSAFKKQLTAAGFQLKGTGWYVTDFRGGSGGTSAPVAAAGTTESSAAPAEAASSASSASDSAGSTATSSTTTSAS
jgi:putative FmdB family regulatory protein